MIRWMLRRWGVALAALVVTLITVALSGAVTAALVYALEGSVQSRNVAVGMGVAVIIAPVFATIALRLVYELDQAHAVVRTLSITDALTGVSNRRRLIERAGEEIARCRRYGGVFGLVMLDVDNLKQVNDSLGHLAGDALLVALAWSCQALCREADTFARLGGDEFAFLLPNATPEGMEAFCARVVTAARQMTTAYAGTTLHATVSIGASLLLPGESEFDQIMRRADVALYTSKRAGRDRVTIT